MRIGLVGSPRDLHLRRWGSALMRAGAEVWVFGLEKEPDDAMREGSYLPTGPPLPYIRVGEGVVRPQYWDFIRYRRSLFRILREYQIDLAHPIHLSPYGVWVYMSGFRPYVPFAMGAELEYTAWGRRQAQRGFWTSHPFLTALRHHTLPLLLRPALREASLILADNYSICENIKLLCKNKILLEVPAGVDLEGRGDNGGNRVHGPSGRSGWILAPRGMTRFYQADYILEGFAHYWEGGGQLCLLLLANLYSADKNILEILNIFSKKYFKKIKVIDRLLSPAEMQEVWQQVVAFISAPSYDGYSYSVAEGRWAGAIPLLNAIPGNLEIATHGYNALLVHPFTPENLANALHALENHLSTLQETFAPRNQQWIQRFSDIENHARLFLKILIENL